MRNFLLLMPYLLLILSSLLNSLIISSSLSIKRPTEHGNGRPVIFKPQTPASCPVPDPSLNYRPVVGILTHPGDGASGRLDNRTGVTNIPASYVKFVESAGARVIPLIHTDPWPKTLEKLNLVNGVLFTGGWAKTGLYFETAKKIFQTALARNDDGDHFPLFGICLGFEIISMIITEDHDICERFSGEDQASTLQFTNIADIQGSVFERFPSELLSKLSTECLAMQNHMKNAFEWASSSIPHTEDAIQVTQHVANYFVREARKSSNRPPAQNVRDNLIYNYAPTYCGKSGKGYDEVYLFS